jgi:hypothetical protein
MRLSQSSIARLLILTLSCATLTACRKEDMSSQPKFYKPYKQTSLFADGTTARPIPANTIARGHLQLEKDLYTGMKVGPDGNLVKDEAGNTVEIDYIPIAIGPDDLKRGQQKFDIYCAVCHGKLGDGGGMIVTRGMIRPPSLVKLDHPPTDQASYIRYVNLQKAPIGHYFHVITNGYGAMYSYNDRVSVGDRWRIAAYIKALQLSQDAGTPLVWPASPTNGAPVPVQSPVQAPAPAPVSSAGANASTAMN